MSSCSSVICNFRIEDSGISEYDYSIYKINNYIGYNNRTNRIEFENSDFSTLMKLVTESLTSTHGGNILIKDGLYIAKTPTLSMIEKPNIIINVSGESNTIIKLDPLSIDNFGYKYVFNALSPGTYKKLYFDGSYREMNGQQRYCGGLLYIGADNVNVQDCIFNDSNYFKIFSYYGQNNILIQRNEFKGASGDDNIGGGAYNNLVVDNNIFNATASKWYAGTNLDTVRATNIKFTNNTTNTPLYLMIEATNGALIENNNFNHVDSDIIIHSDKYYYLETTEPVNNSKNIQVNNNKFTAGGTIYIKSHYIQGKGFTECKDITITGNTFNHPEHTAIITLQDNNNNKPKNITIKDNTFINNNESNELTTNTGMGIVEPSAINIAHGEYITIENNTIVDNRTTKRTIHGIQIGDIYNPNRYMSANHITIKGNLIIGYKNQAINIANPQYSTDINIQPIKIMPLGDSITWGWSYRTKLYNIYLINNHVDFVGSVHESGDTCLDKDQEGHPGYTIDQIINDDLTNWLQTYTPDSIIIHLGTNDVSWIADIQQHAYNKLNNLIDIIISKLPNIKIYLSSLIPRFDTSEMTNRTNLFNTQVPLVVDNQIKKGTKIYYIDMNKANITQNDMNPDKVHPNTSANDKMADNIVNYMTFKY